MKKTVAMIIALLLTLSLSAQTAVSEAQKKQIISKVDKAASALCTMQCHFVQVKKVALMSSTMKSEGTMYFSRPSKLRWQYMSPYDYTFILNNGKAYMKSAKATTTIDVNKNKMFRQVVDVIMNCMIGGELANTSYFKVQVYKSGKSYYACLTPQKKELKQLYSLIMLYFNSQLTMVDKVEMTEKSGDKTTISLSNIAINKTINDKVYSVR